jgi:C4-dicarboxylate transporter, DctQ subunit
MVCNIREFLKDSEKVMFGVFTKMGNVFDRMLNVLMALACVIFIFAMLLVCADVILRYVLNRPLEWTTEVCGYILLGIVVLGAAWLLREEGHVSVDFMLPRLKPSSQALIKIITSVFAAVAIFFLIWYGLENTLFLMENPFAKEPGTLRIHKAFLLIPLVIGCFLLFIQFIRRIVSASKWFLYEKERQKKLISADNNHNSLRREI